MQHPMATVEVECRRPTEENGHCTAYHVALQTPYSDRCRVAPLGSVFCADGRVTVVAMAPGAKCALHAVQCDLTGSDDIMGEAVDWLLTIHHGRYVPRRDWTMVHAN